MPWAPQLPSLTALEHLIQEPAPGKAHVCHRCSRPLGPENQKTALVPSVTRGTSSHRALSPSGRVRAGAEPRRRPPQPAPRHCGPFAGGEQAQTEGGGKVARSGHLGGSSGSQTPATHHVLTSWGACRSCRSPVLKLGENADLEVSKAGVLSEGRTEAERWAHPGKAVQNRSPPRSL